MAKCGGKKKGGKKKVEEEEDKRFKMRTRIIKKLNKLKSLIKFRLFFNIENEVILWI